MSTLLKFEFKLLSLRQAIVGTLILSLVPIVNFLIIQKSALAHHPGGGKIPANFSEGFLSGLGHPVIGIDHLAFIIAIGLLAALVKNKLGMIIPGAFVIATAVGTGIHLLAIDLPIPEIIIAASVLVMGIFLAREKPVNLLLLTSLGAIAGIFHGYAYGESILGAEMTALGAYLIGFSLIQLSISAIAFYGGKLLLDRSAPKSGFNFRLAGFIFSGIGLAFLSSAIF